MSRSAIKWTSIDWAGVGICLALTAAAAWLGFTPIWQHHTNFIQQQRDLQNQKHQDSQQALELKTTQKRLEDAQNQLAKISLRLQATTELNQRLASITDLAAKSTLKIDDIVPGKTTKGRRFDTISIHLAGEGTYPACAVFLHHLKKSMPDIGVQTLHITAAPNATGPAKFTYDLQWFAAPSASSSSDVATAQ